MINRLTGVFIGCVLILSCSTVASADSSSFYIDAKTGNNDADGRSEANAWRTLDRANKMTFAPGDKLLLKAGCSWSGQLRLRGSGTKTNVISVGRYGEGAAPIIAGGGKTDVAVLLDNGSYWVIEDLEVTNLIPDGKLRKQMYGVKVIANSGGIFRQITLRRLHIHSVSGAWDRPGGAGILCISSGNNDALGTRKSRYDGLLIEDCYVHNVSFYGILVFGWENRFRDERRYASTDVVIRNNFTHDTGGDSIVALACEKALIEHNEAHRCAIGQLHGGKTPAAGIWPHSSDGTVMRYNKVLDIKAAMDGQGFDVDINCRNTVVEYNWSERNQGGFLLLCSPDASVPGTVSVIVRNNVSIDDGHALTIAGDVRNVNVQNNAFISTGSGKRPLLYAFTPKGSRKGETDVLFSNNVFSTSGKCSYSINPLVLSTFEGNTYAGDFKGLPADTTGIHVKHPAVQIDDGKVVPTQNKSKFKTFDISKAGLHPTSSWLKQRALSASGKLKKQDGEPRHAGDAK